MEQSIACPRRRFGTSATGGRFLLPKGSDSLRQYLSPAHGASSASRRLSCCGQLRGQPGIALGELQPCVGGSPVRADATSEIKRAANIEDTLAGIVERVHAWRVGQLRHPSWATASPQGEQFGVIGRNAMSSKALERTVAVTVISADAGRRP